MLNLLEFFIRYKHWFLFLLLEACSLVMLFRFNSYQGSAWFTTANTFVGGYYSFASGVSSFFSLHKVNTQLAADNATLQLRLSEMEARMAELTVDSIPDSLSQRYFTVNAQVVNATLHRNENLLTLNKGEADGVRPDMPVICSSGVVGIVSKVSSHYAIVLPLINSDSHVSCRLKDSQYFGTLQWERGDVSVSYVADIPHHAEINKGEIVETNGYSDIFPAGLPIGKVLDFTDSSDGTAYLLRVKLFADFATLRDVTIITNYQNTEREQLEAGN